MALKQTKVSRKPAAPKKKAVTKPRRPESAAAIELRIYWLIYNVALEPDVVALMKESGIKGFSTWQEVTGSGRSGSHQNDDVWPGVNSMHMFAAPMALETQLIQGVQKIRSEFPGEGIKLIVQPCSGIY